MNDDDSEFTTIVLHQVPVDVGTKVAVFRVKEDGPSRTMEFIDYCTYEGDYLANDCSSSKPYQTIEEKLALLEETGSLSYPRLRNAEGLVFWGYDVWWDTIEVVEAYKHTFNKVKTVNPREVYEELTNKRREREEFLAAASLSNVWMTSSKSEVLN